MKNGKPKFRWFIALLLAVVLLTTGLGDNLVIAKTEEPAVEQTDASVTEKTETSASEQENVSASEEQKSEPAKETDISDTQDQAEQTDIADSQDQTEDTKTNLDETDSQLENKEETASAEDEKSQEDSSAVADQEEVQSSDEQEENDRNDLIEFYKEGEEIKKSVDSYYNGYGYGYDNNSYYIWLVKDWNGLNPYTDLTGTYTIEVTAETSYGNFTRSFTVSSADGWGSGKIYTRGIKVNSTEFYAFLNTSANEYTIKEYDPDGKVVEDYAVSCTKYTGSTAVSIAENTYGLGLKVTNTTTDIVPKGIYVKKVWKNVTSGTDYYVKCRLTTDSDYDGNSLSKTFILNEENGYEKDFPNLPRKDKNGEDIVYKVTELGVYDEDDRRPSYPTNYSYRFTTDITEDDGTFTITNTEDYIRCTVKKLWKGLPEGFSSKNAEVSCYLKSYNSYGYLQNIKSVNLDDENNFTESFELDKYDYDGKLYEYRIEGETVKREWHFEYCQSQFDLDYEIVKDGNDWTIYMTNTYKSNDTVDISGTKTWEDGDNADGIRPDYVTVNLLRDGVKIDSKKVSVNEDGEWKYSFENLPKYAEENTGTYDTTDTYWINKLGSFELKNYTQYKYTVTEEPVTGYTTTIDGYDITNTHEIEKTSVEVTKKWDDEDLMKEAGSTYERPAVTLYLTAGGETVMKDGEQYKITLDGTPDENGETESWKATFTDLPKNKNGKAITYEAREIQVSGYNVKEEGTTITNTPVTTEIYNSKPITIRKIDENTGLALTGATFEVRDSEGNSKGSSAATDADGTTTVTFTEPGTYTVTEVGAPTGYQLNEHSFTVVVTKDGIQEVKAKEDVLEKLYNMMVGEGTTECYEDGILTIKDAPKTIDVTLTKVWDDSKNQDGKRAEYGVTLYKTVNGETTAVGEEVTLDPDTLTKTWSDLPAYESGYEVTYSVKETTVPDGYTSSTDEKAVTVKDGKATITNTYTPEKTSLTVKKVWDDSNDKNGKRPSSIKVNLMNGKKVVKTVTLSKKNKWTVTVEDLPVYANQKKITYTWEEKSVPDSYKMTSNKTKGKTTTITNQYKATTSKKDSTTKKSTTPGTGDNSNILLWMLIAAAALCAMIASAMREKRGRR